MKRDDHRHSRATVPSARPQFPTGRLITKDYQVLVRSPCVVHKTPTRNPTHGSGSLTKLPAVSLNAGLA